MKMNTNGQLISAVPELKPEIILNNSQHDYCVLRKYNETLSSIHRYRNCMQDGRHFLEKMFHFLATKLSNKEVHESVRVTAEKLSFK